MHTIVLSIVGGWTLGVIFTACRIPLPVPPLMGLSPATRVQRFAEFWIDCRETRLKVMVVKDRVGKRVVVQTYPPGSCLKMFIGLDEHLVAIRVFDRVRAVNPVGVASTRRYAFWQSQI